jgi:hypothetical protein
MAKIGPRFYLDAFLVTYNGLLGLLQLDGCTQDGPKSCSTADAIFEGRPKRNPRFGLSWGCLGVSWGLLGLSWDSVGPLLGSLGAFLGYLGALLGLSWAPKIAQDAPRVPQDPTCMDFRLGKRGQRWPNGLTFDDLGATLIAPR